MFIWKVGRAVMQHLGKVSSATARGFDSLTFRHIKFYYWLNSLKFRNNIFVFVPLIGLISIPPFFEISHILLNDYNYIYLKFLKKYSQYIVHENVLYSEMKLNNL